LREVEGPSTMIVVYRNGKMNAGGKEHELKHGWIFFIGHGVEVDFTAETELIVYRVYIELPISKDGSSNSTCLEPFRTLINLTSSKHVKKGQKIKKITKKSSPSGTKLSVSIC